MSKISTDQINKEQLSTKWEIIAGALLAKTINAQRITDQTKPGDNAQIGWVLKLAIYIYVENNAKTPIIFTYNKIDTSFKFMGNETLVPFQNERFNINRQPMYDTVNNIVYARTVLIEDNNNQIMVKGDDQVIFEASNNSFSTIPEKVSEVTIFLEAKANKEDKPIYLSVNLRPDKSPYSESIFGFWTFGDWQKHNLKP